MYIKLKRLLDFFSALILFIVFALPMAVIALIIKTAEGGTVLFRQQRPGKHGKLFTIYKFRTMSAETYRNNLPIPEMERITKFGSFLRTTSLDELPQLFNVLCGDMSFIGPRPLLAEYLERYSPRQMRRHDVLPGITGFAQVNGRNAITWEQKFEYDVMYVENINIFLDLKILTKTIINVLKSEGINSNNDITMEEFAGNKTNNLPESDVKDSANTTGLILT